MNQSTIRKREQDPHSTRECNGATRAVLTLVIGLAMAGCSILGAKGDPPTIYAPDPRVVTDPSLPTVQWQLSMSPVSASSMIDSARIAVRPTPGELQVYKDARWANPPPVMLEDALLRALEDSGRIPAVARQGTGVAADYKLVMDLRRFEADYAGNAVPSATIEVNAKLLHASDQDIVGSGTFLQAEPATGTDSARVADAFSKALGELTKELAAWVLITGEAHDTRGHPEPASNKKR
jgi:cholesterol transport system auxiliary component